MAQYRHVMRTDESVTAPGELWPQRYTVNGRSNTQASLEALGDQNYKTRNMLHASMSVTSRQTQIFNACCGELVRQPFRRSSLNESGMQRREDLSGPIPIR